MSDDLIFDYATKYYYSHPEIEDAQRFSLTDIEYDEFKKWLADKDVTYTTQVEHDIDGLIKSAKKEKYYEDIAEQIEALRKETLHNKDMDLETFKPEIKMLLEREIAGRYYYQAGMIESMFSEDKEVIAAIEVLNDSKQYQNILKGN